MGMVIGFPGHVPISAGYKSGRSSERETPDKRSTASTRGAGTSNHWETACLLMPSGAAKPANPPTALMARPKASLRSFMLDRSITSLLQSQAPVHCWGKAMLYTRGMLPKQLIQKALDESGLTQEAFGAKLGVTKQAVNGWLKGKKISRDHAWLVCMIYGIPFSAFPEAKDAPTDLEVVQTAWTQLSAKDRSTLSGMAQLLVQQSAAKPGSEQDK